jgi:hypothetical protein
MTGYLHVPVTTSWVKCICTYKSDRELRLAVHVPLHITAGFITQKWGEMYKLEPQEYRPYERYMFKQ